MTRITLVAFALLTGFFYVTGKPVDKSSTLVNGFAGLAGQNSVVGYAPTSARHPSAPGNSRADGKNTAEHSISGKKGQLTPASLKKRVATLEAPIRNPRRKMAPVHQKEQLATKTAAKPLVKTANVGKTNTTTIFGEVRNKLTTASVKPLVVSYQQRFVKTRKPVLGPRLTAVLMKRELRRVGCYSGNVTSKWDESARGAIVAFNTNSGASLPDNAPTAKSLEKLQQITKTVCTKKPVIGRTIFANANPPAFRTKTVNRSSKWRTRVERKKTAYKAFPKPVTPRYKSVGSIEHAAPARPRAIPRGKRTRVAKKYRTKRLKKIRIAKRKARRKTAVRSWKRTYRRKRFGFRSSNGSFSLEN